MYNEVVLGISNFVYGILLDWNIFQIILCQGVNYVNDDSDFIIELWYYEINWVGKNLVVVGYSFGFIIGYVLVFLYFSLVININGIFEVIDVIDGIFVGIVNGFNIGFICIY